VDRNPHGFHPTRYAKDTRPAGRYRSTLSLPGLSRSVVGCPGQVNHRDRVRPAHLGGGQRRSGPCPGRDCRQRIDLADSSSAAGPAAPPGRSSVSTGQRQDPARSCASPPPRPGGRQVANCPDAVIRSLGATAASAGSRMVPGTAANVTQEDRLASRAAMLRPACYIPGSAPMSWPSS
jgi:hypothetical protein